VVRLQRTATSGRNAASPVEAEFPGWKVLRRTEPSIPLANAVSHAALLHGMQLRAEIVRSCMQRKPMHSVDGGFELRAAW
jgi:hypothetical protein